MKAARKPLNQRFAGRIFAMGRFGISHPGAEARSRASCGSGTGNQSSTLGSLSSVA